MSPLREGLPFGLDPDKQHIYVGDVTIPYDVNSRAVTVDNALKVADILGQFASDEKGNPLPLADIARSLQEAGLRPRNVKTLRDYLEAGLAKSKKQPEKHDALFAARDSLTDVLLQMNMPEEIPPEDRATRTGQYIHVHHKPQKRRPGMKYQSGGRDDYDQ